MKEKSYFEGKVLDQLNVVGGVGGRTVTPTSRKKINPR